MIQAWIEDLHDNTLPDEKNVVCFCAECGCEIYEGETIHIIGHKVYCNDCHREDVAERS